MKVHTYKSLLLTATLLLGSVSTGARALDGSLPVVSSVIKPVFHSFRDSVMAMSTPAVKQTAAQQLHAAQPWPFWDHYAARFITSDGRVVDPDRSSMTTSEGQSYAMFFSIVAGDRAMFERLRAWTEMNLAKGSLGGNLPAWSWGQGPDGGAWGVLDPNSASDSDLWVAYDLLQAGALWSEPTYTRTGQAMLAQIARSEVAILPQLGPVLLPGHDGFHPKPDSWVLNPSYMPPPLVRAAAHVDPSGPWVKMAAALPQILAQTASSGYAMDWVSYTDGSGFVPTGGPGNDPKPPQGSYDAIRVYLWVGISSAENPARAAMLSNLGAMARLLRARPLPPEAVAPDGTPGAAAGPLGYSAALLPFLWGSHENFIADEQQRRVQAGFDPSTGLLGSPPRYYDQNLALFALGWGEKRFRFGADGMLRVPWKK